MKFGKDLQSNMIPEWVHNYCDYQALKQVLKVVQVGAVDEEQTKFFLLVEDELQKVNQFYLQKLNELESQLQQVQNDLSGADTLSSSAKPDSLQLPTMYRELGQMQSYVWLNFQAFSKIMKKYDKHMELRGTDNQKSQLFDKRLETEPFKSARLDAVLELYREVRKVSGGGTSTAQFGEMKLIAGSAAPALAEELAARIGVPLTEAKIERFNDGEVSIQIMENVRGSDVFIVQPTSPPVNDNLMELLLLISAARRASAARVSAIVPYYGYARQDRKDRARVPISAADVARMLEAMGVDRVCCVDLHCGQIQGFFGPRTPVDNLFAGPIALSYFKLKNLKDPVIVSPDAGGVARAKNFMEGMGNICNISDVSLAVIIKQRARAGVVGSMHLVGNVSGCDCIIVDDMIDTAGTLSLAADELKNFGARRVFAFATHGLFNGPAAERLERCALEEVVVANTVPLKKEVQDITKKIRVISVGKLLQGAIRAIHTGESISALFNSDLGGRLLA
uniref:ribose-phosphate diphosphokinase n=1 Tax=Octactis speculum TaxID=3111310 RepID=A0A7S2CKJ3_9STRA|mmetsp:Transcript_37271/g.50435  ORF Transcript_37271/g.50435 Transcript_37271/m.50435 type:complete len:507 (+) Transcript_37271:14-1534(+)|eukprot:CAMPEP_0185774232 /NCGR_PEP_ID=MMETSP1174-20130828/77266_1 /TAXON_ID=35687 /ORGANISM="Dictyocha speculum, Strain CCMP1381" /LENGTH=506 /DNA_ID=CAMNT_0028461295 /DNA_START=12 /DNA_END=1532 /DNA_ORIENTATION=+